MRGMFISFTRQKKPKTACEGWKKQEKVLSKQKYVKDVLRARMNVNGFFHFSQREVRIFVTLFSPSRLS